MMGATMRETGRDQTRDVHWRLIALASAVAAFGMNVIWAAAIPWGPIVCPAILPPPKSCMASHRAGSGLLATIAIAVVYVLTLIAALLDGRVWHRVAVTGVCLLAVAPVVAYLAVAWIPGFPLV
ncbi:MAG: hypothetical protein K0R99_4898 [Microbacterium sp.]|jgi:hypothetical protein|uniref:hypothetical protein n=1 Tax=Microbacterium sp. TaxID=51671 RepID=UPI002615A457|nr:hypothetical protein [Microbacterium sp.]MDF2563452.1 hypothetical protein [Microbacterium sp.]